MSPRFFFWHLSGAGKGDLCVAALETFLTGILGQHLGTLQHGLVIYEKGGIFEWLICGNIPASACLCFSHCEIQTLSLSSVLIPILMVGNRPAEQLQKRSWAVNPRGM